LYCFTIIDSSAKGKFLAERKNFVSQLISERACGYGSYMPSQPLVASIVLLPLHPVGYSAKLWIFMVGLKQLCGIASYGGVVYGFF